MNQNEFTGYVVSRKNINDADKIISVITRDQGRQSFIAKGVRKPKAKLQSQLEPLVETKFRVIGKSKLPTLVGAKGLELNSFFNSSIEANFSALLLTEVIDIFSADEMVSELAYDAYSGAIKYLSDTPKTSLALNYYLLHILKAYGIEPHIETGLNKYFLDFNDGTINSIGGNNSVAIDIETVKLWNACLKHNDRLLDKLNVNKRSLSDSLNLLISYIQHHSDRKIKSAKVLSESTNLLQAS
jgi:DNA repair protein RecO (recombination protein O)